MNKYDWSNAFPKPTKEFHDKLVSALDGLERKKKMKKLSIKRSLIAAAAIMLVGTAAIASSGHIITITGSSSSAPDYLAVPSASELSGKMGASPKILEQFSNGYVFENGNNIKNKIMDEEEGQLSKFTSFTGRYAKADDKLLFSADAEAQAHTSELTELAESYNGVEIHYHAYTGKFVPADYKLTEQDKLDEANGDVVFSYGTDEVILYEIQGVAWEQDGIYYGLTAMSSPLCKNELIAMAKEVIDF